MRCTWRLTRPLPLGTQRAPVVLHLLQLGALGGPANPPVRPHTLLDSGLSWGALGCILFLPASS